MRDSKRTAPFLTGNRVVVLLTALLVAVGLTGLTTTAMAGAGDPGTPLAKKKKKKKKCPRGTHKVVIKKHGKKKRKCVQNKTTPVPTPAAAALTISSASFTFPTTTHHGFPCANIPSQCTTQPFTVSNIGRSPSGVPASSITEVTNPGGPGQPAAFAIGANTCTAPLPPAGTCTVTVQFAPNDNQNGYVSVLHVAATPGGDAQAQMSGDAN